MVTHAFDPSTLATEAGRAVSSRPSWWTYSKTLSLIKKQTVAVLFHYRFPY